MSHCLVPDPPCYEVWLSGLFREPVCSQCDGPWVLGANINPLPHASPSLLPLSYRYHNVGILVLFLHDVNDVQLEFTKLNVYFKHRGGVYHRLNDIISNIGCLTFSVSW